MGAGPLRRMRPGRALPAAATVAGVLAAAAIAALAVTASPESPVGLVAVAGIFLLALAVVQPLALVGLALLAIPLEGFARGAIVGPAQALVGVAALGWLVRWAASAPIRLPRQPALVAFALVVVANAIGVLIAEQPAMVMRQTTTWGTMLVVAACIVQSRPEERPRHVRNLLVALAIGGGLAGLIAIVHPQPLTAAVFGGGEATRATAGFGSPNALGILLALALPLQLVLMLQGRPVVRWAAAVCALLSGVGLALAVSRGAFLGLAAGLLVLLLWRPFLHKALIFAPLLVVLVIASPNPAPQIVDTRQIVERLAEVRTTASANLRLPIWKGSLRMIEDHPLLGVGALQYVEQAPRYGLNTVQGVPNHAHNVFLTIAAELGLFALAAFLALLWWVFAGLRRAAVRTEPPVPGLALGLTASLVSVLVSGMLDYGLGSGPLAIAFFTVVGCSIALGAHAEQPPAIRARGTGPAGAAAP